MSDTAVLGGLVAALTTVVSVLAFLLKRRNGPATPRQTVEEEIARNIDLIERLGMDLPRNWRIYVDERIRHKTRNLAMFFQTIAAMIDRGLGEKASKILKEEAEALLREE